MKYEYVVRLNQDRPSIQAWLNDQAEDGYRFVTVTGPAGSIIIIMERPVHEPSPAEVEARDAAELNAAREAALAKTQATLEANWEARYARDEAMLVEMRRGSVDDW